MTIGLCLGLALAACGGDGGGTAGSGTAVGVAGGTATPSPTASATATPSPTPSATATATTSGTPTTTASLEGIDAIPSNFDVSAYLSPAEVPGPDVQVGAFRFVCVPSHNAVADPIVYPGQPGKGHLHTFFGNTKTDAYSTYQSLRTTGESTCNNLLNRSAYWIPSMMTPAGKVVMPNFVTIYYKRRPDTDPYCKVEGTACIPLPRGLRYIFGYTMGDGQGLGSADILCDNGKGVVYRTIPEAAKDCAIGQSLILRRSGPTCWDGKNLDVPDHHSHMAFPSWATGNEVCPADHPYVVPGFTIAAFYTVDATLDRSGDMSVDAKTWYLSSDRMPGMTRQVPGSTFHSDWFGAWDDTIMKLWTANCINKLLSCTGGNLGNGQIMNQNSGYNGLSGTVLVDPPA